MATLFTNNFLYLQPLGRVFLTKRQTKTKTGGKTDRYASRNSSLDKKVCKLVRHQIFSPNKPFL